MSDFDTTSDGDAPTHDHGGDGIRISCFTADGETVLFDDESAERWIQSDTAVPLSEAA